MHERLLPRQPDAVFAVEDFTALGAMQTIKEAGFSIPGDIAIIGFANELFSEYLTPSLSTVNQHTVRMGEEAAGLFFEVLNKRISLKTSPRKLITGTGDHLPPIQRGTQFVTFHFRIFPGSCYTLNRMPCAHRCYATPQC